MKTKTLYKLILLICISSDLYTQTITHPWWIVDRGGGRSTADTFKLQSSIGQPAIQKMSYLDTVMKCESGFIPSLRTISGAYTSHEFSFVDGWNMISVPLLVDDYRKASLFCTTLSSAFSYEGSYVIKDTLNNGSGYWLKFSGEQTRTIMGSGYMLDTIDVLGGWNIIGTLSYSMLTSDILSIAPVTITSNFFGYDGGYKSEDTLKPGLGYWVKTNSAGKLVFKISTPLLNNTIPVSVQKKQSPSSSSITRIAEEKRLNKLLITDAEGKSARLFFTVNPVEIDMEKTELPPSPPSGIFDVRFKSNRTVELADQKKHDEKQTFPISINCGKDPFTISWELNGDDHPYSLEVVYEKDKSKTYELNGNSQLILNTANILGMKLVMDASNAVELPKEFALHQNYPNPFNPITKIKYDLPHYSKVMLKIYNLLGQEVETLVDEIQDAGFKTVEWNATLVPGGVYFYRLSLDAEGNSFTAVKKVLLLK
jgi:hypothetical protein